MCADAASQQPQHKQKVSVVIPCYYSEKMIAKVVALTRDELVDAGYPYEFVLVNDGSTDGTFDQIRQLAAADANVVGVNLMRNFGQHSAIMAGLHHVSGDIVMLMDDDMQTHPSQCLKLLDRLEESGCDVVFAKFTQQREALWRRAGSRFAAWSVRTLTKRDKSIETSNFLAMRRIVADEVVKYEGPYVYVQGLIMRTTKNAANVDVQHFDREEGQSGYTLKALIRLWSIILNFSMLPLRMASVVGCVLGLLGLVAGVVLVIQKIVTPDMQLGWSSLMVAISVCSGLILLFLGVVGEYLGRLFMSASKTPQYVLREVVNEPAGRESAGREERRDVVTAKEDTHGE